MKTLVLTLLSAIVLIVHSYAQPHYWQQQVDYRIDVSLNDSEHTLDGYLKLQYYNRSPDTLDFIWFHLWPNAFKNDQTAYTDQALEDGSTKFYFSGKEQRGYINRLDFRINGVAAHTEDHPQYIDIIKVLLDKPLVPGKSVEITTPFHEKIQENFSRGGHVGQAYQISQWYPKPAVFDKKGWHPMPYLDQGEYYGEFGNYEVRITLPRNYIVAATGELQNEDEKDWLKTRSPVAGSSNKPKIENKLSVKTNRTTAKFPSSDKETKTLVFKQNNVHDFAWFADKRFVVSADTMQLPSGRTIHVQSFFLPDDAAAWQQSVDVIKNTIRTRSEWIGEYPYDVASVVEAHLAFDGGIEYPTITCVSPFDSESALALVIEHETGHNWFYAVLANNERNYMYMDEGFNTYYDNRYLKQKGNVSELFISQLSQTLLKVRYANHKDQPINTASEKYNTINYNLIGYEKTAMWMKVLEEQMGKETFDKAMQAYFSRWKFRHPYPEDFRNVMEEISGKNLEATFALLDKTGPLKESKSDTKAGFLLSPSYLKQIVLSPAKTNITVAPAIGFNSYDKFMIGAAITNYLPPLNNFKFFVAPMYATGSGSFAGIGRLSYTGYPANTFQRITATLGGARFNTNLFTDTSGNKHYTGFSKIVPSLKFVFKEASARSTTEKFIQWKTYFINEEHLRFRTDTVGGNPVQVISKLKSNRYLNQVRFVVENYRKLYPYNAELNIDQAADFIRAGITGNYYFNYPKKGGANLRVFAGKFIYTGSKTLLKEFNTDPFHLNLTGPEGYEDYTYSDYFVGRSEFDGWRSQQIMQRDGFFKVRTDLLSSKIGKSDDWLVAMNLTTDVPENLNPLSILPVKIPLKAFLDIGTYSEAWQQIQDNEETTGKFLFDAGLQLSIFKNIVNIYIPIIYSKVYSDYFKSVYDKKRFWKTISFSIDIQKFRLRNLDSNLDL